MELELTYLSLNAPPAAPFALTEMTASSKFHDEAASAIPAPSTSTESNKERRNLMIGDVVVCC